MEKTLRAVLPWVGIALVTVSLFFIFGTVGAIEHETMTYDGTLKLFVSFLSVLFVGAILTNVKGEKE